jgi:thioesterase domain-containing protein
MMQSRSALLRHLADLKLEEIELLHAPASRLAGGSRAVSAARTSWLRQQAAQLRASAAALEPDHEPLLVNDEADLATEGKKAANWLHPQHH